MTRLPVSSFHRVRVPIGSDLPVAAAARAVLVTALAASLLACGTTPPPEPASNTVARTGVTISDADAKAAGITTATAQTVERADPLRASGLVTFDERRTARLGSFVEGVVGAIAVQPGDRVAAGQVLARLHSHVVHDTWAGYFKAQAEVRRLEAELAYASTVESRAVKLVGDKALSPQELERAQADVNAARQALTGARAEVTRAEQELSHYGLTARPDADPRRDDEVPVAAPFAGTVIERLVTEGAAVTPGTPVIVLSDLSRVWVTAEIDEGRLGQLVTGRPVTIEAAAYPGVTFPGTLTAIGDVVNPTTRRVTLRIETANADRRLKPQMFVSVTLGASRPQTMLVVPSRAVQTMEGETVVFVRTSTGTFTRRSVSVGADIDGAIEVVRGLTAGDVVATAGAFLLKSELLKPAGEE